MARRNPTMVTPRRSTRSAETTTPTQTQTLTYSSFPKSKPGLTTPSKKRKAQENDEIQTTSPTTKRVHLTTTSRLSHVSIPIKSENSYIPKPVQRPTHLIPPFFAFYTSLPLLPTSMPLLNLARHLHIEPRVVREMVVVSQQTCLKLSTSTGRGLGEMIYFPACNPLLLAKARAEVQDVIARWEGEILGCELRVESLMAKQEVKKEEEEMDIDMDDVPAVPIAQPPTSHLTFDLHTRNRILQERIRNKLPAMVPSREDTVRAVAESKAVHVTGVLTGMLLCAGGRRSFSIDEVVERVMGSVSGMGRKEVECALEILSCGKPINGVAVKLVDSRGVKAVVVRRV